VVSFRDEVPFGADVLRGVEKARSPADITPLDQMGIDDKTRLRMLRLFFFRRHGIRGDDISKIAGEDPALRRLRPRGHHARAETGARRCEAYRR